MPLIPYIDAGRGDARGQEKDGGDDDQPAPSHLVRFAFMAKIFLAP